ncbi:MAG: Stp1/IreP family PP2C-type Ser/Thr phosphatase [Ilumatobacteraceae bacterium]
MKLSWGAYTDTGMVRQQNEDSFIAEENLYVVADGMGGHNAGEVASALAVTTLRSGAKDGVVEADRLRELVQQANTAIYTASLDDSTQSGMGTTLTAVVVVPGVEPRVMVANVGDSRTYLWRDQHLSRITVDHSYVQELVNEGIITPEEARTHPRRNIVTRALGIDRSVAVDVFSQVVRTGDRLVLCSDGLVDEVPDADIAAALGVHRDPQLAAEALVMLANENGGRDNTTVVVVDVLDDVSDPVEMPTTPDHTAPIEGLATTKPARKERLTLGVALFWSVAVALVVSAVTIVGVWARSGYYLAFDDDDRVTIYRGRVGGVLWFEPTIDTQTELDRNELPDDILAEVESNRSFVSSASARKYLDFLKIAVIDPATSTTTTSTTTPATTSTTGD